MSKYECCSGPGRGLGVFFALQLGTVGFESIFPLKKNIHKMTTVRPSFQVYV